MKRLEQLWADVLAGTGGRLAVVYGRRQVGKTFLLAHLVHRLRARGGRAVMATALQDAGASQQLAALIASIRQDLPEDADLLPERFADWTAALRWLLAVAERSPLTVVLDEVPWYIGATRSWRSLVQVAWDEVRRSRRPPALLLVLTGSAVSVMRTLVGAGDALFGRADDEIEVQPFDLPTAARFLGQVQPDRMIETYAACGGFPLHLRAWDVEAPTQQNLHRLFFEPGALMAHTGERMIADVSSDGGHRAVLHAIGAGARTHAAVSRDAGQRLDRSRILLLQAGLIRIERPLGSPDRTPGLYSLTDPYLQCWHELCWADLGLIDGGQGAAVLSRRLPRWQRHLGRVFEEQARAHAVRLALSGRLPSDAVYGRWWTTSGKQDEVDVLGMVDKRSVLIGEAKWGSRPLDARILGDLRRRASVVPEPVAEVQLAYWSRAEPVVDRTIAALQFGPADMVN